MRLTTATGCLLILISSNSLDAFQWNLPYLHRLETRYSYYDSFKLPSVRPLVHENLNTIHNHACTMVKYELWGNNVDIISTASMDQIFVKEPIIVLLFDYYPI